MNDPPTVDDQLLAPPVDHIRDAEHLLSLFLDGKTRVPREDKAPTLMRLSASGDCTRKAIFMKHDPIREDLSAKSLSIFELGDALHAMERGDLLALGFPLKRVEDKVRLVVPAGPVMSYDDEAPHGEGTEIPGHIDGIITIGGEDVLLDVKTMNENSFKRLDREGISASYRAQLNSYLHALGLTKAILWCYSKNTSERRLMTYTYDPALQDKIFLHFRTVHNHQPGDPLPPVPDEYLPYDQVRLRKKTGLSVLYFKCSYCPFRERCWPMYRLDETSDKPRFIYDTLAAELDAEIADL